MLNLDDPPPPNFESYNPDYFDIGNGDIVSHDSHLNSDGEALYRFLLSQSLNVPAFRLSCKGSHLETRTRWVTHQQENSRSHSESYTVTVTDFDFIIDITQHVLSPPLHWSVPDTDPVYRGRMVREIQLPTTTRAPSSAELVQYKLWLNERSARGLPPWATSNDRPPEFVDVPDDSGVFRSSKSLREWADEYCASPKYLKEFVYEKAVYSWNIAQLESAVRSAITNTLYQGDVNVRFTTSASKIYIRSDNKLSRLLSNGWLKFLCYILLIYPFIWLFRRFHSCGGGRWEVCGGAYALKRPSSVVDHPSKSAPIGTREGEWFRDWEHTIIEAVRNRYQSTTPLYTPTRRVDDALMLDGYL